MRIIDHTEDRAFVYLIVGISILILLGLFRLPAVVPPIIDSRYEEIVRMIDDDSNSPWLTYSDRTQAKRALAKRQFGLLKTIFLNWGLREAKRSDTTCYSYNLLHRYHTQITRDTSRAHAYQNLAAYFNCSPFVRQRPTTNFLALTKNPVYTELRSSLSSSDFFSVQLCYLTQDFCELLINSHSSYQETLKQGLIPPPIAELPSTPRRTDSTRKVPLSPTASADANEKPSTPSREPIRTAAPPEVTLVKTFRPRNTALYTSAATGKARTVEGNCVLEIGTRYQRNQDYYMRLQQSGNDLLVNVYFLDDVNRFSLDKYRHILRAIQYSLELYLAINRDDFSNISYEFAGDTRISVTANDPIPNRATAIFTEIRRYLAQNYQTYTDMGRVKGLSYTPILLEGIHDQAKVETILTIQAYNVFAPLN